MSHEISLALSRQQVRDFDRFCIEELKVPGIVLMENAGKNAAETIFQAIDAKPANIAIVAGGGNNGGDGFVIARHLINIGYRVRTFVVADEQKIAGDARTNLEILKNIGADIEFLIDPKGENDRVGFLADMLEDADLVIDAIGGTGITGALRFNVALAVEQVNQACDRETKPVIAIDIPTGLDCDTGHADGPVIVAVLTITFVASKTGFINPEAKLFTGEVKIADIGIDPNIFAS